VHDQALFQRHFVASAAAIAAYGDAARRAIRVTKFLFPDHDPISYRVPVVIALG